MPWIFVAIYTDSPEYKISNDGLVHNEFIELWIVTPKKKNHKKIKISTNQIKN